MQSCALTCFINLDMIRRTQSSSFSKSCCSTTAVYVKTALRVLVGSSKDSSDDSFLCVLDAKQDDSTIVRNLKKCENKVSVKV